MVILGARINSLSPPLFELTRGWDTKIIVTECQIQKSLVDRITGTSARLARFCLNQILLALVIQMVTVCLNTLAYCCIKGAMYGYILYYCLTTLICVFVLLNMLIGAVSKISIGSRLVRGYLFCFVFVIFKILNIAYVLPVSKGYLFKLVYNYRLVVVLSTMVFFSGQPLILLSFTTFLSSEAEREIVRGGAKGKGKTGKKFFAKPNKGMKLEPVVEYIPDSSSAVDNVIMDKFVRKTTPGKRRFADTSKNDRKARFDQICNFRSNKLTNPGVHLLCGWRDHQFTFGEKDKEKFRCIGWRYLVTSIDGRNEWRHGENSCFYDSVFGIYCNSVSIRNKNDFDCALEVFNNASLKVTRACLAGAYGDAFRNEYINWLGNAEQLMSNDLLEPLCNELNIRVLGIWHGDAPNFGQRFCFYGDRGCFNGCFDVNLINGVIANVNEPPHFSLVENLTLSSKFTQSRPVPGEITIEDVMWNFENRGIFTHFMWVNRPEGKTIPVIPDVAGDLKKAPNPTRIVPTIQRSNVKTTLRAKLTSEGVDLEETTKYSPRKKDDSDFDPCALDDLFGAKPVAENKSSESESTSTTTSTPSVSLTSADSSKDSSSSNDDPSSSSSDDDPSSSSSAKEVVGVVKPLTIVTTSSEIITPPADRFLDVSGVLCWNIRTAIPSLLHTEAEHSTIFKFLLNIWGESGLTSLVYASQVVRQFIAMTHEPKVLFNSTRKWTRLVRAASYLGRCGNVDGYFTKMVEARKKMEGNNIYIENPKSRTCGNAKYFNRRVIDSIQWKYLKTVEADEVFDYAAGVNQIHKRQILYSANLVEYMEVDWSDVEQLREFIAEFSNNMKAVPLKINRYFTPYRKTFVINLAWVGGKWVDDFVTTGPAFRIERRSVKCFVDIYGRRLTGHNFDEDFDLITQGKNRSPVFDDSEMIERIQEVQLDDWDDLYEFEQIMMLATLSSCYRAVSHNFVFDMGIVTELCSPKVFSGSSTFQGISDRIDTVASSVCSKFNTNKLTAHYGVTVELNSIRVAKCIAKSYVEKLSNKQCIDELPPEEVHKVRQVRSQVKNLDRVYGNGVTAVNRTLKSIIGYNTDEISDMPKMKPTVNNFNICKVDKQRDCNPTVRKITAVTNYNVYGCLSPIPNTVNANNVREAFIKRIGCAVPEPCEAVKVLLPAYMEHFINCFDLKGKVSQTMVGELERYMNWDTYKLTLRYDPCRLKELEKIRKEVDALATFEFSDTKEGKMLHELWTSIEAHVKWESYKGEMKYARMIFARVDWFKVMFGSYAKITQQVIYETLPQFCATNLAVKDLPKHMVEKYRLCSLILSTDFSAFEGHNYPWIMYNVFFKFLISIWGIEFDVELFVCMGIMTSTNNIVNCFVWCKIDAKVMSGEVWTSICNWITNVIFISFIVECEGFCYNTGFFSHKFAFKFFRGTKMPPINTVLVFTAAGDDGMTGLPLLPWIDYSVLNNDKYLEIYGVFLKLEMKDGIAGSGFLSKVYSENDMQTLCDPVKQLAKGILPIKYANSKIGVKKALARARAMSLLYEFGSCPVVASYARCIIRCTRNVQMNRALINLKKDDWYAFEKIKEALLWYDENEKGKYDNKSVIGLESRMIVEDSFGIPVCTQFVMEKYFDETDDTSYPIEFNVPCIDLICPKTESEFYEKYTFDRKMDEKSLVVCVNYVPEREVVVDVEKTDSNWFDFLNRDTTFFVVACSA